MSVRKTRLVDCNPDFRTWDGRDDHAPDALAFDCPEGHEGCRIFVQFTPATDGSARVAQQRNGQQWIRTGDLFETLTLTPSIRSLGPCFFHGFVTNGAITFCGDSK